MHRQAIVRSDLTLNEAKEKLGFPPSAKPSESEVRKALREKTLGAHPDTGASGEELKELSDAQDILLGKLAPAYEYDRATPPSPSTSDPFRGPSPPSGYSGYKYTAPESKTVKFEEAIGKSGVPSGVEWQFVTATQRDKGGWMGDSSSKSDVYFVAYGRTASQHVFFAAHHHTESSSFVLGGYFHDIWAAKSFEHSIKSDEGSNPAWIYGRVTQAFQAMGFNGRFNSKIRPVPAGWTLKDKHPYGSDTSIKHWLVNSGQVPGDTPSVGNRKQTVELMMERSSFGDQKPGHWPAPRSRSNFWDGRYHGDYYKLTLILNGRPYVLDEADTTKFLGLKAGGKTALDLIYGQYYYGGEKKQLTRMAKGKVILTWMAENFTGLPAEAVDVLKAAAAQMK